MIVTFADILDHIRDYGGTDASVGATARYRRAVQNAYNLIATRHEWSYLRGIARVITNAPYSTGTIEYDYTGGTYENMVTLTGGTWPTWIASGYLVISNVPYKVDQRKSSTVITLTAASAPTSDIASGTEYEALQDQYPLPADFVAGDEATINEIATVLEYAHPRDWASQRRVNSGAGQPVMHTYLGNSATRGQLAIAIWPPSDASYVIDILYKRAPRALVYAEVGADEGQGVVSATASSTTITGDTTAFASAMIGSVIRFSSDGETAPTGQTGGSPAAVERTITDVASATSLTVDSAMPSTLSGVRYVISDPVDIDVPVMYEYFCREVEKQFRLIARSKLTNEELGAYNQSLAQAREADSRNQSRAASMRGQSVRSGFDHYPMDWSA